MRTELVEDRSLGEGGIVPACVPHAESRIGKIPFYARGDAGGYEGAVGGMAR